MNALIAIIRTCARRVSKKVHPSLGFIFLPFYLLSTPAYSHAPSWSVQSEASPVALRFTYTDGKPMSFSKIRVLSPNGKIFQMGNADRDGFFAFIPPLSNEQKTSDIEQLWTVSAIGDEGHEIQAQVSADASSIIQSKQFAMSATLAWLLVASVVTNFAFIGAALERYMRPRNQSSRTTSKRNH